MKKLLLLVLIMGLLVSLSGCGRRPMENMTTGWHDGVHAVFWNDRIYLPYGPLTAYAKRGGQIGILDGDSGHKVYACKGYSTDEWIAAALPYDPAMLYREINVTDIPEGWESEYEWND